VGDNSVIDDYCYFSTRIVIGKHCHVAASCTVGGGREYTFSLANYCSVSSGTRIWCKSNDYSQDLVILHHTEGINLKDDPIGGDVSIGEMCGVGANSVIMPSNIIPEGVVIGALSFVPSEFEFEPWSVYAGSPIRLVKRRNKNRVLRQRAILEDWLENKA
jgi:acetyltransferase-like isoleucine patch superfamily enzyme